jgi:hypothetical protein
MMKFEVSIKEYLLFIEAWIFLAIARFIIIFFSFSTVAQMLGEIDRSTTDIDMENLFGKSRPTAIGTAILRASRRSPWRAKCLENALAAKFMFNLRKEKYIVFLGVSTIMHPKPISAHVWFISNGQIITGGNATNAFKIIGKFHG